MICGLNIWWNQNQCLSSHRFCCETSDVCECHSQVSTDCLKHEKHFQEQVTHPVSVQCPVRQFQILLNCEKLMFVSCTSNLLEQMCGYRRYIMFLQTWILNLQDLPQNQSPETVPIYIAQQYYPRDNIVLHSLVWWIYEISLFRRLSQALVHFVMDRASLFTDHNISGRPILAK